MEFEFDKEIDALLRQTAQGSEAAFADSKSNIQNPKSPHLDADGISAFAENALPEKTKTFYVAHLADCERCRKILSNVVASNSETRTETAAPVNDKLKISAAAAIPWYKKLFAAPSLAYAMGALVLVFAGLIALTFLKNAPRNAEVSSINEKPTNMGGASGDGETVATERETAAPTASMSNAGSMSNSAAMTNSSMMSNTAAATRGGSTSNGAASVLNNSSVAQSEAAKNKSPEQTAPQQKAVAENQMNGANFADRNRETSDKSADAPVFQQQDEAKKSNAQPTAKPAPPAPSSALSTGTASAPPSANLAAKSRNAPRADAEKSETKKVGDKNFRRDGGVWYDAAYSGQSTTNIARGSSEYRKLDSGLRSIAETLSGTIVVVWKAKAYRIQ